MSNGKGPEDPLAKLLEALADHVDITEGLDIDAAAPAAYSLFRKLDLPLGHFSVTGATAIREAWIAKTELDNLTPEDFNA